MGKVDLKFLHHMLKFSCDPCLMVAFLFFLSFSKVWHPVALGLALTNSIVLNLKYFPLLPNRCVYKNWHLNYTKVQIRTIICIPYHSRFFASNVR